MKNNLLVDLFIQLFAQGEEEPTEDEVEVVDTDEDEVEEDTETETEENEEETEDDSDDVEFDDSEEEETKEEEVKQETKKDPVKERKTKNYNAAKERVEARKKKELEQAKRDAYIDGVKKSTGGVNRFTDEPIVDDIDVQIFETMCEMEKQGLDPIEDYHKYVAKKERERAQQEAQAKASEVAKQKRIDGELDEFVTTYGEDVLKNILNDDNFAEFAEDLIDRVPIKTIYERYLKYEAKTQTKAEELALEKDARRKASSGALKKKESKEKSWNDMSPEEFHKFSISVANRY